MPADVPKDSVEEFRPMAQYRTLKEDGLSSWGFLDDQAFALRMAAVFAVGWVPGVSFGLLIFPVQQAETGAFSIQNLVAAVLLGTFLGFCVLLAVVIRIVAPLGRLAREWDTVNKLLQRKSYYVEYDPTRKMEYGSGSGGAYSYRRVKTREELRRDRLLANYETEPALGRLRVYLVSVLVAAGTAAVGGLSVGGQVKQATVQDEEEEEFEPEVAALLNKDKREKRRG